VEKMFKSEVCISKTYECDSHSVAGRKVWYKLHAGIWEAGSRLHEKWNERGFSSCSSGLAFHLCVDRSRVTIHTIELRDHEIVRTEQNKNCFTKELTEKTYEASSRLNVLNYTEG
jgi:hypothetical protein